MPTAPGRRCARCGTVVPSSRRRCVCQPAWSGRTHRAGGRAVTRARERRLRDSPICATPGCGRIATRDDHIVPLAEGGADLDEENHQTLCQRCHDAKSKAEAARGRARRRR